MARDRIITFRGEDYTLCTDASGNWSLYRGGDNNEVTDLTEEETERIDQIIFDGYSDEVDLER